MLEAILLPFTSPAMTCLPTCAHTGKRPFAVHVAREAVLPSRHVHKLRTPINVQLVAGQEVIGQGPSNAAGVGCWLCLPANGPFARGLWRTWLLAHRVCAMHGLPVPMPWPGRCLAWCGEACMACQPPGQPVWRGCAANGASGALQVRKCGSEGESGF